MILWLFNFVALFQISVLRLFPAHGPSKTTITPKPLIFFGSLPQPPLFMWMSELSSFSSSGSYPFGFWAPVILNHKLIYQRKTFYSPKASDDILETQITLFYTMCFFLYINIDKSWQGQVVYTGLFHNCEITLVYTIIIFL